MAPVLEHEHRRAVRISKKGELQTGAPAWPWTVGDDSEGEDDVRPALKAKRRVRRQEIIDIDVEPPPQEGEVAVPPSPEDQLLESSSPSETDGISSDTSGDEEEDPGQLDGGVPTPEVETSSSTIDQPTEEPTETTISSSSSTSESSTTTVSQSFTTLIPGGVGVPLSQSEEDESASRTITSLTPILTVSESETTYTSFSVFTTVDEPATTWSTSISESSSVSRAAQSSAVAEADSSPTPQIIRVHHHPHGLSKDAIHGLIAFGALGGLMGVLAVAWFFWRRHKKRDRHYSSKEGSDDAFARPSRISLLLARVPFLKNRFGDRSWNNIDEPYYRDNNNSRTSVFLEKSVSVKSSSRPRLDSQFFSPSQVMGVAVRVQAGDKPPAISQNVSNGLGHQPGASFSSTSPQRSNTVRNQNPPFPTNPTKRISEISSLSSGFGDGEMIVPSGQSTMERLPQPPPSAKFPESIASSRRDTVYTEASEDQPPRFRNVNSWVRQQTGRVKRSQAKTQAEDAPPVPQMPAEEDYAMMLPDGEEPRRPQNAQAGFDFGLRST